MARVTCPACIMRDPDEVAACWRCGGNGYVEEDPLPDCPVCKRPFGECDPTAHELAQGSVTVGRAVVVVREDDEEDRHYGPPYHDGEPPNIPAYGTGE